MTTYNTYQEAKIANPECEISISMSGIFAASDYVANIALSGCVQGWNECNPADYCMTVEKFLADGNKFQVGDYFISIDGMAVIVGGVYGEGKIVGLYDVNNALDTSGADKCFILRAAALEEKKQRTKVEYVKCEFSHAWEAVKAFEDGEKLYTKRSHKDYILIDNAPDVLRFLYDLHERIETTMTEREEFIGLRYMS